MRRLSSVILKINSDLRRMGVSDRLQLWGSSRRTSERRRSGECHSRRRDQCLLRQAKKAVEPSPKGLFGRIITKTNTSVKEVETLHLFIHTRDTEELPKTYFFHTLDLLSTKNFSS